jgi:actin-like ATPase involved in cell morphogenesis
MLVKMYMATGRPASSEAGLLFAIGQEGWVAYQLGIDLGTTFTAAATHRGGRVEIAMLGNRAASVPSVVFLREDETVLTGEAANRRAASEPGRVAREFKRRVGDTTPVILGGSPYSADALMAKLLRWVVDAVTEREGGPPDQIAISYPANWGPYKKDLLDQAIRQADVGGATTLTEPEAAATYYASNERVEVGDVVAVYDLGGGTFDAAVLRKTDSGFEILGQPEGIERLGGIDFDEAVFAHVARALDGALERLDPSDPSAVAAVARLRQECAEAKESLSSDTEASIPVLLPTIQREIRLTRGEFESMVRPPLAETIDALRRALRSAGVDPSDVTAVLLVGGSSRIPLVAQMVSAELGRPVAVDAHPKHAVALGAALAAAGSPRGEVEMTVPREETEAMAAPPPEAVAERVPIGPPSSTKRSRPRSPALVLVALAVAAVVGGGYLLFGRGGDPEPSAGDGTPSPGSASPTTGETPAPTELSWTRVAAEEASLGGANDQVMFRAAEGGPGLVGVGSDGSGGDLDAAVWTSQDGASWTRVPHEDALFGGESDQHMNSVVAGGPGLVAVGFDHSAGHSDASVWASSDGITWSRVTDEAMFGGAGDQTMNRVTTGGPGLVAVGYDVSGGTVQAAAWTSADGASWSRVVSDPSELGGGRMRSVVALGSRLVAVGFVRSGENDDAAVWTLEDGSWSRVRHEDAVFGGDGDQQMATVAAGGPGLVAVGFDSSGGDSDAAVWTSPDGVRWSLVPRDDGAFGGRREQVMNFVLETPHGVIAVGYDGSAGNLDSAIWSSDDGIEWVRSASTDELGGPGEQQIKGLTVLDGRLVSTGWDGSGGDLDAAVWITDLSS